MSRTGELVTLIFEAFDMHFYYCDDWIEINNGTGTVKTPTVVSSELKAGQMSKYLLIKNLFQYSMT